MRSRHVTLLLVLGALAFPTAATFWMLTTRPPERDDERWFEYAVRQSAVDMRETLRATALRPVIGWFSPPPPRGCVVKMAGDVQVE